MTGLASCTLIRRSPIRFYSTAFLAKDVIFAIDKTDMMNFSAISHFNEVIHVILPCTLIKGPLIFVDSHHTWSTMMAAT